MFFIPWIYNILFFAELKQTTIILFVRQITVISLFQAMDVFFDMFQL